MVMIEAETLNQLSRRGSSLDVTLVIGNRDLVLPQALHFVLVKRHARNAALQLPLFHRDLFCLQPREVYWQCQLSLESAL